MPRPVLLALPLCLTALGSCRTLVAPEEGYAPRPGEPRVEHDRFAAVLAAYVDERGRVDYAALSEDPEQLERYYAQLAAASPDSAPELFPEAADRLAYWINAYNACALVSVVRLWPIDSVEDAHVPWWIGFLPDLAGFFYLRNHVLGGVEINLRDLERKIVLGRFDDARVHFALNCASASCPELPREAFDPQRLDEQFEREAFEFFGRAQNLRLEGDVLWASAILDWYRDDFLEALEGAVDETPTLIEYCASYAPPELAARIAELGPDARIEFLPYDWRINGRSLERDGDTAP